MSDEDEFEKLERAASMLRKKPKQAASTPSTALDEMAELRQSHQARIATEARVKKEETIKDEKLTVKKVFTDEQEAMRKELDKVIEQQEKVQAELLKADGPPPQGFYSSPAPPATSEGVRWNSIAPFTEISKNELENGSFRSRFGDRSSSLSGNKQASIGELNYLFKQAVLDSNGDEILSTACYDTLVSLVTGDFEAYFSSRASILSQKSNAGLKASPLCGGWKLNHGLVEAVLLQEYLRSESLPKSNARRALRAIELLARMDLLEDPAEVLYLVLKFTCFARSELLESEIRGCINEITSKLPESEEEIGKSGERMKQLIVEPGDSKPKDIFAWEQSLHRVVRICSLCTSSNLTQRYSVAILRCFVQDGLSPPDTSTSEVEISLSARLKADDEDDDDIDDEPSDRDQSVAELVRQLTLFLQRDVIKAHDKARPQLKPHHFHRWQALVRLIDFGLYQVEPSMQSKTRSFVYRKLQSIHNMVDKTFMTAYTNLIECIRFVRKQCESFVPDPLADRFVQQKLNFGSSSSPANKV